MGKQKVILLRDPGWLPGGSVNLMYKVLGVMRGGNKWGADPSLKVVAGKNFRFSALQSGSLPSGSSGLSQVPPFLFFPGN